MKIVEDLEKRKLFNNFMGILIENNVIDSSFSDKRFNIRKKYISNNILESLKLFTIKCRDNLSERIYWILNFIEDYPNCDYCRQTISASFLWF